MTEHEHQADADALPHDIDAERITIGAAIEDRRALDQVTDIAQPEDYYRPAHAMILTAARGLADAGAPLSAVSVGAELTKRGEITRCGGAVYLADCVAEVPSVANAGYYARIVADRARLRALVGAGRRVTQLGRDGEGDVDDLEERARDAIETATRPRGTGDLAPLGDALPEWMDAVEKPEDTTKVVAPPYRDLTDQLAGWRPGQLAILAARPSVGKSTVALDIARAAAIRDAHPVLFCSLEMSRDELLDRIASAEARVSLRHITDHNLAESDWAALANAHDRLAAAPLYLDDTASCSLAHLRARLRHMQRRQPARLVVVDYLQLMTPPAGVDSRQEQVSQLARGLKLIAKEFGVPIIALSQLNRAVESRNDKRPQLSDLRDSGSLEQDSDLVILLSRPDYQDKDHDRSGELDLIVAKQRNGPTGETTVASQLHYARFVDMTRH